MPSIRQRFHLSPCSDFRSHFCHVQGLFMWLTWPAYISNLVGRPVFTVMMFALAGRFASSPEATQGYITGVTLYIAAWILIGGIAQSFYYERIFGTISVLFASGGSRFLNYAARGVLPQRSSRLHNWSCHWLARFRS